MRLLNVDSLDFAEFRDDKRPPYVAASHRWMRDGEAAFQDVRDRRNTSGEAYQKVEAFAAYIRKHLSPIKWLWIDTCCINKDSAAELSEAINSMFEWYHSAELCLAYLVDVRTGDGISTFEKSEWFKRGWTLQELLAPRTVVFVTNEWHVVGYKGSSTCGECRPLLGFGLEKTIARVTGIPEQVLHNYEAGYALSIDEKLKWMDGRETTRPEDMSYALFGILSVTLPAIYGERYDGARQRLLLALHQQENIAAQQAESYRKIVDWLASPDPWTNHESARQQHEPHTGAWLLRHHQYLAWKVRSCRLLWVYGKAGCGKTILCSTAIEDMRTHCQNATNTGHAIFYFSFSDNHKQTYQNLIVSLAVQLGKKEPGRSMLRQAYEKAERGQPGLDDLQNILLASIASYDDVVLHLDALDECPEGDGVRQNVLNGIEELLERASNVRLLVTSRDMPNVRCLMEKLSAEPLSIAAQTVNADIQKYVSTQMSRDHGLSRLERFRKMIEETLAQKSDGMFRWVYCQLQMLKGVKTSRPSSVQAALRTLPKDLDETYKRMLDKITGDDRRYALTLLRWLAYAQSPPSLAELAEASIVDPTDNAAADGVVDVEDRGGWEDTLEILAGLVIVEEADDGDLDDGVGKLDAPNDARGDSMTQLHQRIGKDTKVRLAHFSVKEYLESSRILAGNAKDFYLDPVKEHRFLAQSCLVYLVHYSSSSQKTSSWQDLAMFPLLGYAAESWFYHSAIQDAVTATREVAFLCSETTLRDWLRVHQPDRTSARRFGKLKTIGSGLYYASILGLGHVVSEMIDGGADVNRQGGFYCNALQAAAVYGHEKVVQMLVNAGANVNTQSRPHGNALQMASIYGEEKVVQVLIRAGADVHTQGGEFGNALQAASRYGHDDVARMLMDAGADVDAQGGKYGNAIRAALTFTHENAVRVLTSARANVNARGRHFEKTLQAALARGSEEILQMLIDAGVRVNTAEGLFVTGNALQAASADGRKEIVQMLIDAGVDVNAAEGSFVTGNALQAASARGSKEIVQMLVDAGADVHTVGRRYGTPLEAALNRGHEEIVQILLGAGA